MDMISIIEKELDKKAKINFEPMQPGDVKASFADIERSKELLSFEPKTSISSGIPKVIEWYKSYFKV